MVQMHLYIGEEDLDTIKEFKKIAAREGKPTSQILKEFMRDYIKKHGEGNPNFSIEKWVKDPKFQAFPTLGEDPRKYALQDYTNKDLAELRVKTRHWDAYVKAEMLKRDDLWRIA